ncbi:class I SAM-dependent methyltransferase [Vallitalea okinawensis]|uniref:class I SAM-dependent methyltransferase n=1 Tax=Vallitalea okinawensis TaxID=2078660 RepID=UPI000CFACB2C|nr:class I SAM-dependent methyltransferase [Vallitalea okinawensis]
MRHEERMHFIMNQEVTLDGDFKGNMILDIGGGGEGIIGLCYGSRVVSIDPNRGELEEAAEGPVKIVMDSRELLFLDESFDTATSFFTLMYIDSKDHATVFKEIYRVLKEDGQFVMWDTTIPKYNNGDKDIFVVKLRVETPIKSIETGYGVLWENKEQSIDYYADLGRKAGFKVVRREVNDQTFKIVFSK